MSDISFSTVLGYSPYDNKCPVPFSEESQSDTKGLTNEDLFFKNFFVNYPITCKKIEQELKESIDDSDIHYLIFSGASGSGKTTFLNSFFRNSPQYHSQFINLIENPSKMDSEECIRTTISNKIGSIFNKNVAQKFKVKYIKKKEILNGVDLSFLGQKMFKPFIAFCNSFSRETSKLNVYSFLDTLKSDDTFDTAQLLSFYMLSYIVYSEVNSKNGPLVFIFDNLDEMDKQYLNSQFYDIISSAFSISQDYCEKVLEYDFIKNVTFILAFRNENERFFGSSETHDRYRVLHAKNIYFTNECQVNYNDILNKRLLYYKNNGGNNDILNKYNEIKALISSEYNYFENFIKPLYTYDYRMYSHYAMKGAIRDMQIPTLAIKNDKREEFRQGAKGYLLFVSLAGMLADEHSRFSSYVKEEFEDETCNVFRMSFSLLTNLCGWSHNKEMDMGVLQDEDDFNAKTKPVYLSLFMDKILSWYGDNKIIKDNVCSKVLDGLIGTTACSFECPITLLGNEIDKYTKELGGNFSMSALASNVIKDYLNDPHKLSAVEIRVNPLCIVYATKIFIHYEYFNLISTAWDNPEKGKRGNMNYNPSPLFQFCDTKNDKIKIEMCLAYTFATMKSVVDSADKHFCKKCSSKGSCKNNKNCLEHINQFIKNTFCINTTHAVRVITSHIHYLENYRRFLWNQKTEHNNDDIIVHKIILNTIIKYITYFNNRKIQDDRYPWLSTDDKYRNNTKNWHQQYLNAKAVLENGNGFVEVNLETPQKISE